MPALSDEEAMRRIASFEDELDRAIAERIEPVGEGMTAYLDTRIPRVWDANYLIVEPGVTAQQAAAKADEVLGGLGMTHRAVAPAAQESAAELEPGFRELGWDVERGIYMLLRGEPDRPADIEVERIDFEAAQILRRELMRDDEKMDHDPETIEQLLELDRRVDEALHGRWFAARVDGELAGCCQLMQAQAIGQVEDVVTLTAARNRGVARTVVLAAASASVADGDELTFIGALADDWPRLLYEKLGFDTVGSWEYFRLKPPKGT
jgi:GNAT superfamily N-acetyltransferase